MNEQALLILLEQAQAALDDGASMMDVNAVVREKTGGQFPGMMSLGLALGPDALKNSSSQQIVEMGRDEADADPESALQQASTVSPTRDFAESFIQGISFGAADDVLGEGFAERLENRREVNPGASLLAESAGLLVPGMGAGKIAAKASGGIFRKALALGGVGGAESAALAAGEAEAGQEPGTVGAAERLKAGAGGFALGAPFGVAIGLAGPILSGVGRMLRSDASLARIASKEAVEQTGKTADELFDLVRQRSTQIGGEVSVLADVAPELGVQAQRFATGGTRAIGRAGGPLEVLRARVMPEEVRKATAQVFRAFDDRVTNNKPLIKALTSNSEISDATRSVIKGDVGNLKTVTFEQLQSVRNGLRNQFRSAKATGNVTSMNRISQTRIHLDTQMERVFPGFARANENFIELLSRQEGAEELIRAIDKALPQITPDVPQVGGLFSSVYKAVSRPARRRKIIMEMVGEALLTDGEAGIEQLTNLLKQGKLAQLFGGIETIRGVTRGAVLAQPGGLINPDSNRL